MASISATTPPRLNFSNPKLCTLFPLRRPAYPSSLPFPSHSHHHSLSADATTLCRCLNPSSDSPSPSDDSVNRRWDSMFQDAVRNAIKRFDSYMNSLRNESQSDGGSAPVAERDSRKEVGKKREDKEWDWDRWCKHFREVDNQDCLVSILKSQLGHAVYLEDYGDAAKLKVAIAAAATNDNVGRVMSHFDRAIEEERYSDAAFLRDKAGAGLVGWWSGISKDGDDPEGLIIRITPEHGRYVARSYSPGELGTSAAGVPLFEVFLTMNKKGEYKLQAVYLKRRGAFHHPQASPSGAVDGAERTSSVEPPEDRSELFVVSTEDPESGDDRGDGSDPAEGLHGFQNVSKDMIPGVKVKILKVTAPEKVDKDLISQVIEQILEEEDEDEDEDEGEDDEEEEEKDNETESLEQEEDDEIETNAGPKTVTHEGQNEIAVKVVISGLFQKFASNIAARNLLRVPAKMEKKGHGSFSFTVEKEVKQQDSDGEDTSTKIRGQDGFDHVMFDLARFIGRGKVPSKVLKDVGELISLTLSQAQNHQPLSGSTIFNRIKITSSPDPFNGLYIGIHGLYSTDVIQMRRRFGQWQEESDAKEPSNLEFYEYVEAVKLTGDAYVPAGQVAFRAKVGKRYQLPLKGVIPEEFGVIARFKGQGRLAELGFQNPRWVDGEFVLLNGKYIKGGPAIGFLFRPPQYCWLEDSVIHCKFFHMRFRRYSSPLSFLQAA